MFSKLEGNYDGTFQNSTGQLDPNINSAFDYADFLVNAQGQLSNEHKHQLKLDGSYSLDRRRARRPELRRRRSTGIRACRSPRTATRFAYANWEYYLTPRGSLGYGPSDYEADVHVGYPIKFGGA